MSSPTGSDLAVIARGAMLQRGLLPEFAQDVLAEELGLLARQCTDHGNNANKVERQVWKSAAALLLASRVGEQFDAIVTGASERGAWVRPVTPMVDGRVVTGFEGFDVGDRVRVELLATNVGQAFIDFRGRGEAQRRDGRGDESPRERRP